MTLALPTRRAALLAPPWASPDLWRRAQAVPSLDLRFAERKDLIDVISGLQLITYTRASSGTFVGSGRMVETAGTNVPRFDHNPITGECLGLLVEGQRANLLLYSEDTSQWLTPVNVTLSQNQTTAPDGASTADRYLETSATGLHAQESPPFLFVTGITYTYSVFVKSIEGRNFEIGYPPITFTARFARFNLSGAGSVQGVDAGITAGIQAYPDGWFRCWATNTCASGTSARIANSINNASFSRNYAGNTSSGVFIWGSQLEAGSFPTSYIPTTTAAVTRSADVVSITGTNFSSWYRQGGGSVYWEGSRAATTGYPGRFDFTDGTNANRVIAYWDAAVNSSTFEVVAGSVSQVAIYGGQPAINTALKAAFGLAANDVAVVYSGGLLATDTSAIVPVVSQVTIGAGLSGTIRRLTYWPQRLSSSTLRFITR